MISNNVLKFVKCREENHLYANLMSDKEALKQIGETE